jgi:hypothetical protein
MVEGTYGGGEHTVDVSDFNTLEIIVSGQAGQDGERGTGMDYNYGGYGGDGGYISSEVDVSGTNQLTLQVASGRTSPYLNGGDGGVGSTATGFQVEEEGHGGDGGWGGGHTAVRTGGSSGTIILAGGGGGGGGGGEGYSSEGEVAEGGGGGGGASGGSKGLGEGTYGEDADTGTGADGGDGGDGNGSDNSRAQSGTDGSHYYDSAVVSSPTTGTSGSDASVTLKVPRNPPKNVSVDTVEADFVDLSWDSDMPDVNETFNIYRSKSSGVSTSDTNSGNTNSESYSDTSVTEDTTYYYAIEAEYNNDPSDLSSEVQAVVPKAAVGKVRINGSVVPLASNKVNINGETKKVATIKVRKDGSIKNIQ